MDTKVQTNAREENQKHDILLQINKKSKKTERLA